MNKVNKAAWDDLRAVLHETADLLYQPAETLDERTKQLARPSTLEDDGGPNATRVLVFTVGEERYGWPVNRVRAITRAGRVTPVPSAPMYYSGVLSFRGRVLSVLDLRAYLGLPPLLQMLEFLIVIEGAGLEIGVLASDVFDVHSIPPGNFVSASAAGLDTELITGVTPDGLTLLDAEALLRRERQRVESE